MHASLIFLNNSWNHLTDKSKSHFPLLTYISRLKIGQYFPNLGKQYTNIGMHRGQW